jgi:hypothetical protein
MSVGFGVRPGCGRRGRVSSFCHVLQT